MTKLARVGISPFGLLAPLGALALGGCTYDVGEGGGTVVTETREPVYVYATSNLFTNNNYEVPVCWHPASTGTQAGKDYFEQIVREQWESNTNLRFTGFIPCTTTTSPWVPIHIVRGIGGAGGRANAGIGARLGDDGAMGTKYPADAQMTITYDEDQYCPTCSPPDTRTMVRFPAFAAHEMGHVLGLVHEHKRPDGDNGSDSCVIPRVGDDNTILSGQVFATVHDPLSVMHYCGLSVDGKSVNGNGVNIVSGLDIIGMQMIYGLPPTATKELGFMRVVSSGSLQPAFSFNSSGMANSFFRHGTGSYTATMPRIGKFGGNVQVTPYNSINRCSISGWASGGGDGVLASVNCYDNAGNFADADFTVSFVGGSDTGQGGYVWAYDPTNDFYQATGIYTFSSNSQPVNIDRTSAGVYDVIFVGQNFPGGTAEVSGYGGGTDYCKVDSIARINNFSDKRVRVRCFSRTGSPLDALFSLRVNAASPLNMYSYSYALADQPTQTQTYTPSSANRLAFRQNMVGGTTNLSPLTVRRSSQGVYIVTMPQMPYTTDPLYLYKKSNLHVTAVGTGNEYCNISTLTGDSLGQNEQSSAALVICLNAGGTAVDSKFIISYGSMLVDAPDSAILSTVERLPSNGASGIGGLALASGNLYFTSSFDNVAGGQIMRLSPNGGTPTSIVSGQSATGLYADSSNLIWIGNNSVKKSTLGGGTITTLASNQSLLFGNPTADATNVFYRTKQTALGTATRINKVSRAGGTPVALTAFDQISSDPVADGSFVYFAAFTLTGNRIAKVPVNGGTVTNIVSNKGGGAIARSGSTLYFTDFNTNDLYKVPTGGGTATLIATGMPRATATTLTVDGTNVYGVLQDPGNLIFKASVNGGSPTPKASFVAFHESVKSRLAFDSSNAYYVTTTGTNGWLTVSRSTK